MPASPNPPLPATMAPDDLFRLAAQAVASNALRRGGHPCAARPLGHLEHGIGAAGKGCGGALRLPREAP